MSPKRKLREVELHPDDFPRHYKKAPKHKPFGIKIEYWSAFFNKVFTSHQWYATEKSRDQAFEAIVRTSFYLERDATFQRIKR